jgi:hypothetical protein
VRPQHPKSDPEGQEAFKKLHCDVPELNLIETACAYLRANRLASSVVETYDDIGPRCCDAWNFFANDSATVRLLPAQNL